MLVIVAFSATLFLKDVLMIVDFLSDFIREGYVVVV